MCGSASTGSQCSIQFGKVITTAAPGSVKGLFLIVTDIKAARAELIGRGADVSEVFHVEGGLSFSRTKGRVPGRRLAPLLRHPSPALVKAFEGSGVRLFKLHQSL